MKLNFYLYFFKTFSRKISIYLNELNDYFFYIQYKSSKIEDKKMYYLGIFQHLMYILGHINTLVLILMTVVH